jgi:hypothetical protein
MVDANAQFFYTTDHTTWAKRHYLSQFLREKTESIVQRGILKGYQIGPSHWAEAAVGAYLLGTYEVQVCALLNRLAAPGRVLVDIGAADGLYGVGLVAVGAFARSVCFEADDTARTNLHALIDTLGLSDKVTILGKAEPDSFASLLATSGVALDGAVVLCDIEGAEFNLLTPALLQTLSRCHVIVETHEFLISESEDDGKTLAGLMERAGRDFHIHAVRDGLRDMRGIPLLEDWSDADVWSICMEGRKRMMTWLYLAPRHEEPLTDRDIDGIVCAYQRDMFAGSD